MSEQSDDLCLAAAHRNQKDTMTRNPSSSKKYLTQIERKYRGIKEWENTALLLCLDIEEQHLANMSGFRADRQERIDKDRQKIWRDARR